MYLQEGYVPQYSYEIKHHIIEKYDFEIIILGMNIAGKRIDYLTIMDTERNFETTVVKENWEKTNETLNQSLTPLLSEEEIEKLASGTCNLIQFENVSYMLFTNKVESGFACDLFKCENGKAVKRASFEVSFQVMYNSDMINFFQVFEDNTICICDEIWFNEELEQIDKEKLVRSEYLLSEDEIAESLKETKVEELITVAENIWISKQDRIGDMEYCVLLGEGIYLVEFDLQGKVLSAIRIEGISETPASKFVPKKYNVESNEYYDVKH
ncbi:MAG: hypothetical protein ACI4TK_10630 [Agathobacter sp.]